MKSYTEQLEETIENLQEQLAKAEYKLSQVPNMIPPVGAIRLSIHLYDGKFIYSNISLEMVEKYEEAIIDEYRRMCKTIEYSTGSPYPKQLTIDWKTK